MRLILRVIGAALLVLLGVVIGLVVSAIPKEKPTAVTAIRSELPGEPMDLEVSDGVGYATLFEGSIVRVEVHDGRVTWRTAANGLTNPRGLAVTGDTVFVAVLGEPPCESGPHCPDDRLVRERLNIGVSNARVLSLHINGDGTLGEPQTVLDGIPFTTRDHGVNDLEMGPDGMLYLSVGGLDYLWQDPASLEIVDHPHLDWIGSVIRIDPDSGEAAIWAMGFRNLYGLAFSPDGRLFGVDNDGPTLGGWRQEELVEITKGANFGYPLDGSFGPFKARTAFPIYALGTTGNAGIAWAGDGVATGSCGQVERVGFINRDGAYQVRRSDSVSLVGAVDGCATGVVLTAGGVLAATWGAAAIYFFPDQ